MVYQGGACDWQHGAAPIILPGRTMVVWFRGHVRRVVSNEWCELRFTDCRHPWQNAVCDRDDIEAWKDVE